ncbi:thiolase family protein [Rhodococcus sp. BP-252]|uniref:thiolase family protein n=1 Tax=unclassified Rhodococcus (in: high G+C Gram-positive bacteria) TaxID=192944 RepID=UPI001C9B3E3F|nr:MULTISPECIES: thiolase family protein [unclassified Rhodococcus (in: high G+C Gram-positive bacteria)]MBY6414393.1 thiolase family protein [Rhodococcus sp. BP-320]MBY6419530.1 thiolase family protein [Rhodococcus sp. BP-321]MBY6424029.1 thiolase family protein [Rhodococcus sp. BP-324]MBY6429240.1 thiolase family protein [Rhodococcus sp. BP-323]MBY6434199.1 thiolase family protein [Rhodococcus sp. BP-322]
MNAIDAAIVSAVEVPYTRHPDDTDTTEQLLTTAIARAVSQAGMTLADVDGLGVSSFTLKPDHAVDLALRSGLSLRWLMEDTNGGASGVNMLQHAVRAIEAGDADTIVLVAGDRMTASDFRSVVDDYNVITRDYVTPLGMGGPNAMFAMLTQRHMRQHSLDETAYGAVAVAQRRWATLNPGAVYQSEMTMDDYLMSPIIASPLRRFDCVPPVTGSDAIVITRQENVRAGQSSVRVSAIGGSVNWDRHEGDGLRTGLAGIAPALWNRAGLNPSDVDVVSVYDDYPVMALIQLADMGFAPTGNVRDIADRLLSDHWPVNTSGGQLSAGQAGSAAGMHGLVEAVTQLLGDAGNRQVPDARTAVVSGYGMVTYRYGACANLAILERV